MTLDPQTWAGAARLVSDPARAASLVRDVLTKAQRHRQVLREVAADLSGLAALVRAWASGEYRHVPWRTVVMAAGALLYFANPLDLVPDVVLVAGYLDDVTVIGLVAAALRRDLDRFRAWQEQVGGARAWGLAGLGAWGPEGL